MQYVVENGFSRKKKFDPKLSQKYTFSPKNMQNPRLPQGSIGAQCLFRAFPTIFFAFHLCMYYVLSRLQLNQVTQLFFVHSPALHLLCTLSRGCLQCSFHHLKLLQGVMAKLNDFGGVGKAWSILTWNVSCFNHSSNNQKTLLVVMIHYLASYLLQKATLCQRYIHFKLIIMVQLNDNLKNFRLVLKKW